MFTFLSLHFVVSLVFFVAAFYLILRYSQSGDREALESAPEPKPMPNMELELVHRDLKLLLKNYNKLSPVERGPMRVELYDLESKLKEIKSKTGVDYQAHKKACAEMIASWNDYFDAFFEASFLSRSLFPKVTQEIKFFKVHYKSAVARHATIQAKLEARERIWLQEGKNKQAEAEIKSFIMEAHSSAEKKESAAEKTEEATLEVATSTSAERTGKTEVLISMLPTVENFAFSDKSLNLEQIPAQLLRGANLVQSRFSGVTIKGEAEITSSNFTAVDFATSVFGEGVKRFINCQFSGCSFESVSFKDVSFYDCHFASCNFDKAKINNSSFIGSHFESCNTAGVDFTKAILSYQIRAEIEGKN